MAPKFKEFNLFQVKRMATAVEADERVELRVKPLATAVEAGERAKLRVEPLVNQYYDCLAEGYNLVEMAILDQLSHQYPLL
jgi:DNA repair photolyase